MIDVATLGAFAAVSFMAVLLPGPDIFYVLSRALSRGRVDGVFAALGISTGLTVHVTFATLGLSALVYASDAAFMVMKVIGAGYILYLAYGILTDASAFAPDVEPTQRHPDTRGEAFARGFLTNVLNPKAAIFMIALLPQFVSAEGPAPALQIATLGLELILISALVFSSLAIAAGAARRHIFANPAIMRAQRWTSAGLLSASALYLLVAERK